MNRMSRKQIIILASLGGFVVLVVVFGLLSRSGVISGIPLLPGMGGEEIPGEVPGGSPEEVLFTSEVPEDAVPTPPKTETPASTNPDLGTKILGFDLRASRGGFSPSSIVVNHGDTLVIDFTAVDDDYDLDIPYLGVYFPAVSEGSTKKLPLDTSLPGTFTFQCRNSCPLTGVIRGELIVLP